MAEFSQALISFMSSDDAVVRSLITLLILVLGHLGVKASKFSLKNLWIRGKEGLTKKKVDERYEAIQYVGYILDGLVIVLALIYLQTGVPGQIPAEFAEFLPNLLSAILIGILGIIAINLTTKIGSQFLRKAGIHRYLKEIGLSGNAMNLISGLVKGFLYLILLQIALTQLGIGQSFVQQLITASSWAAAFLIAGLIFYGFKDLFKNVAAGVYLKNSRLVRPGEEIKINDDTGKIRNISLFSTSVDTEEGYTLLTPNSRIMDSDMRFKRTKSDIETLEDMKNHFIAHEPGYCGPASMEMTLDIFGYQGSQEKIGEKSGCTEEGVDQEKLRESVEELTDNEVKTAFIEHDKISDVGDEFKAWFNDGALIVPVFDKSSIFPDHDSGDYALAVGFEANEVLMIDPAIQNGGVYYLEKRKLQEAMKDKGYIVLAPEGTTAQWRIKNNLLYGDKNYYDELSKTLETRLTKMLRQGRILKDVMPGSVQKYMENWRTQGYVTRLWQPEEEGDENGTSDSR